MPKPYNLATCPCCNTLRHRKEAKKATAQVKTREESIYVYHSELETTPFDSLKVESFH